MVTEAQLVQAAVGAIVSKKGGTAFEKLRKTMGLVTAPIRGLFHGN